MSVISTAASSASKFITKNASAISLGSTLLGAASTLKQSKAQQRVAKTNVNKIGIERQAVARNTAAQIDLRKDDLRRTLGTQTAIRGASGVKTNTGASLLTRQKAIDLANKDISTLQANLGLTNQLLGIESQEEEEQGKDARTSGLIRAGTGLLQGGINAARLNR